jgi:rhodanese-related sulfurtransferase
LIGDTVLTRVSKKGASLMFGWFKSGDAIRTFTPGELSDVLRENDGALVLADVREANEWAGGHIPGAVHVPLSRFAAAVAKLPKDRKIIFYCQSGMRSKNAMHQAMTMGLPAEGHLGGGMSEWRRHDMPVAR